MPHWREWMDNKSDYVKAWDLKGREVTLQIAKAQQGTIEDKKKRKKDRMPVVYFVAKPGKEACKPLGMNVTNCKTVSGMYGNDPTKWPGKWITLYPTTTDSSDGVVDCIRIRPMVPQDTRDDSPKADKQPTRDIDPADDVERLNDPSDEERS